jgi:hypothetical protein
MDEIEGTFLSLNQGQQFQQKRNKNTKQKKQSNVLEGFTNDTDTSDVLTTQRIPVFLNQYNRIKQNQTVSNADIHQLTRLQDQYDSLVQQLQTEQANVKKEGDNYLTLTSPNNPLLSQNITTDNSQGELPFVSSNIGGYVTDKGLFKNFPDQSTFNATAGKNGCPANVTSGVTMNKYSSLIQNGSDMKSGQSCGNEGKNVYVSRMVTDPTATYQGCFYDPDPPLTVASNYTFNDCQTYAVENGYTYFAMKGAPDQNGLSTCLVSNNDISGYASATDIVTTVQLWTTNGLTDINGNPKATDHTSVMINNMGQLVFSDASNNTQTFALSTNSTGCGMNYSVTNSYDSPGSDLKHLTNSTLEQCKKITLTTPGARGFVMNTSNGTEFWIKSQFSRIRKSNSRAIYVIAKQGSQSQCRFYMILQSDGNLCIYKGLNPTQNQGGIWCAMTNGKQQYSNPAWVSSMGKYGVSYLMSGIQNLNIGEWVGSDDGALQLMMDPSGNLVLNTSTMTRGCSQTTGSTGNNFYGDAPANNTSAIYQVNQQGILGNLGNVAYIDNDSTAHLYPTDMLGYSNNYTIYKNFDSPGNDIPSSSNAIGSADDCKTACNTTTGCTGFVWAQDDTGNQCQLKNANMFPNGIMSSGRTMYVRRPSVENNGKLCNKKIVDIDSIRYANYNQGEAMTPDAPFCRDVVISDSTKSKIEELQSRMVVKGQEISAKIQELYQRDKTIFDKMDVNNDNLKKKISEYKRIVMIKNNNRAYNPEPLNNDVSDVNGNKKEGMQNLDINDVNGMLADTDLRVLQENYSYVLWSVLAVGLLTITINVMKANNK